MKQFKIRGVVAALSLFILLLSFSNSYSEELKVGASYAPPYYTVQGDTVTGLLGDLMAKTLTTAGYTYTWRPYPTKRVYLNIILGELDVYLGPLKPTLDGFDKSVIWSKESPVSIELRSYHLGNKPQITKAKDLSGKNILIISGYTYGGLINYIYDPKNHVKFNEIQSFAQGVSMLKEGRADYCLDYRKTADLYLNDNNEPALNHSILFNVDLHFLVSKQNPNAKEILNRLEEAFQIIRQKE